MAKVISGHSKPKSVMAKRVESQLIKKVIGMYSWFTDSHSYGTLLAIWDHTGLPATRHK